MRATDATISVVRHVLAAAASVALLTAIPIVLYIGAAIISNDPGGPLNVVLVPLLSVAVAVGTTVVIYVPFAVLFQWLARKHRVPFWLPLLIFASLSFLFFILWGFLAMERPPPIGHLGFAALFAAFFTFGFVVYWLALVLGQRVQKLFRRHENVP